MPAQPYLQLIRLPNLFTAAADSLAGWLLVGGALAQVQGWGPLALASACTYAGGIVLNDVFDLAIDRVERPRRPLPSGRVGLGTARILGFGLLALGLLLAYLARTRYGLAVEAALIAAVLAYDLGMKRTVLGPEVMGLCRGLNLLLGMSQSADLGGPYAWLAAASYAGFVAGITWISRSEVETGLWKNIALGLTLQDLAFAGLLAAGVMLGHGSGTTIGEGPMPIPGVIALLAIATVLNRRAFAAIREPTPKAIQHAVRSGIMALVWIHAGVLLAARGPAESLAVAALWVPAAIARRWVDPT